MHGITERSPCHTTEAARKRHMKPEHQLPSQESKAPHRSADVPTVHAASESEDIRLLLLRIRSGDGRDEEAESDAFAALMDRYLPLIEKTVSRFDRSQVSDADREDLRQEALMSLYRAALSFDLCQKHVSFGLYAQICMTNRLISCVRSLSRRAQEQLLSLEDEAEIPADERGDPAYAYEARERLEHTYGVLRRVLSSFEFTVWRAYLGGKTAREIAEEVGKTEKSVTNAIGRIRKKLKTARSEFEF